MWDSHAFGTWQASSDADGRLVSSFAWEYPPKTPGYALHLAARLPAEDYDGVRYNPPTHDLTVVWFGKTPDTLAAAVNEAVNAIVPGASWAFSATGSTRTLSTTVIDASASEPYSCSVDGRPGTAVTFAVTTTPGWRGSEVTITPTGAATIPNVYTVPGVLGSMPCPMRLTHTFDQITSKQAIGCRRAPGGTAGFTQSYAGNNDAAALDGVCTQATMTAAMATVGAPASIDSNLYRGWYMAAVRVKQPDATPADTTLHALVTTTGSGVAENSTFTTAAVPATVQNLYEVVYLGPFPLPAGPVPDVDTGSGYDAGATISQTTHDADLTIDGSVLMAGQTFPMTVGQRLHTVTIRAGAAGVGFTPHLNVFATAAGLPTGSMLADVAFADVPANTNRTIIVDFVAPATGTYAFAIDTVDSALRYNTAGGYADGQAVRLTAGWAAVTGDDLYFSAVIQNPLGFVSTVAIQAKNAGAGTVALDNVTLIPYDEWSAIAALDCAANEGALLDVPGDSPDDVTAYLAKTGGSIGPVSQSLIDWQGLPLIWPGTSAVVVAAQTPGNAAPTGGDLTVVYKPTYQTPYGG